MILYSYSCRSKIKYMYMYRYSIKLYFLLTTIGTHVSSVDDMVHVEGLPLNDGCSPLPVPSILKNMHNVNNKQVIRSAITTSCSLVRHTRDPAAAAVRYALHVQSNTKSSAFPALFFFVSIFSIQLYPDQGKILSFCLSKQILIYLLTHETMEGRSVQPPGTSATQMPLTTWGGFTAHLPDMQSLQLFVEKFENETKVKHRL